MSERLKYLGTSIVLQEVPDEISLAISISGCPYKCDGCHSKYLWEYKGRYLTDDLADILNEYLGLVSCICIMGGDQNIKELTECINTIHSEGYKCCLYLGCDTIPKNIPTVEYLKIGHYDKHLGGLDAPNTNQVMYKYNGKEYVDITNRFKKG